MNAEALIGMVLGSCKLQRLIGQGGMGVVFLAQQSLPSRQVAVKVLLPIVPLTPQQQAAFLESFRRETVVTASLVHPNIVPVYEYGEQNGLPYLVMPYLDGGTLRDELERSGPLPLSKAADYLEQMAAALEIAHGRGIIHRDIKPANMMKTREGRLVLTDFGLVKITTEGQPAQTHITNLGGLVGTPDYIAPEQVLGAPMDARADLYSLGVILYQMVTGTVPFKADMAMQVAMQHVHATPPSPCSLRPDLPIAAEQVILRALAKNPNERFMQVQDLAHAFRQALVTPGLRAEGNASPLFPVSSGMNNPVNKRSYPRRKLLDPVWRNSSSIDLPLGNDAAPGVPVSPLETGAFPQFFPTTPTSTNLYAPPPVPEWSAVNGQATTGTGYFNQTSALVPTRQTGTLGLGASGIYMASPSVTGALMPPSVERPTSTMKLSQPVKVVKVPVAGQPGMYRTGVLPVLEAEDRPLPYAEKFVELNSFIRKNMRQLALIAAALVLLFGSSMLWLTYVASNQNQAAKQAVQPTPTPDMAARATMAAQATVNANTILVDGLNENMHNWPVSTGKNPVFVFKNGAYHIAPNDNTHSGIALLPDETFSSPLAYTVTIQEINGDDQSIYNKFGTIMRYNTLQKNGKTVTTFYSFDVINVKNGEYEFRKFDDSYGPNVNPYTMIWSHTFGPEYHTGHGKNTFKVIMNKDRFTFIVNDKQVGTTQDNALADGQVGLFVNLNGTEAAFSNLILAHS